jgi:hypothetical protein|tara:strand:+ start:2012 stop:2986 length:975 start_codon:yes stop_codon:yes gene_type:complete
MNIKFLITIIGLLLFNTTFGQDREKYSELIREASGLYKAKEYIKSGEKYSDAFIALNNQGKITDRYNAACSWALAKEIDSSFVQLFKIAKNGNYKNIKQITKDKDLKKLHSDRRWKEVILIVTENKEQAEKDLDKPLMETLRIIHQEDQKYRRQINKVEKKHGWKSDEMTAHWEIINEKDSINLIKVEKILNDRGWLGSKIIGAQGNATLFLVIQHSDIETQLKYLPMMREAVKIRNARASDLALLEDRVALKQGKRQIYGSQIHIDKNGEKFVAPLIDPENVDKRRAKVGLETLADYIGFWNLTWDIKKHKKRIATIEAEKKE